jgi:hypothetical protein
MSSLEFQSSSSVFIDHGRELPSFFRIFGSSSRLLSSFPPFAAHRFIYYAGSYIFAIEEILNV